MISKKRLNPMVSTGHKIWNMAVKANCIRESNRGVQKVDIDSGIVFLLENQKCLIGRFPRLLQRLLLRERGEPEATAAKRTTRTCL